MPVSLRLQDPSIAVVLRRGETLSPLLKLMNQEDSCCARMLRFVRSTDPKLVFFDNGKLSVKIYCAELEELFTKIN
jgi:hypothetical protein